MAKCIIHVGMHTTGTASIQQGLQGLDTGLFLYPTLHTTPNHGAALISVFAAEPGRHPLNQKLAQNPDALKAAIDTAQGSLTDAIAAAGARSLLLCSESILSLKPQELRRMKDFLTRHGCDVVVTAYVPSPDFYMASNFEQHVRSGDMRNLDLGKLQPRYRQRLAKFDAVFGRDKVLLWPYRPDELSGGSVVRDFCTRLGVAGERRAEVRFDEPLPRDMVALLLQYCRWAEAQNLPAPGRQDLVQLSDLISVEGPRRLRFGPALLAPALEAQHDDIAWVEERMAAAFPKPEDAQDNVDRLEDLMAPVPGVAEQLRSVLPSAWSTASFEGEDAPCRIIQAFLAASKQRPTALPSREWSKELHVMPIIDGSPITDPPRPLVNRDKKLTVLWSPKAACTTVYVWFSHLSGFDKDVREYANWPHRHREERYQMSHFYAESLADKPLENRLLRVIRDPYGRAVSIYRHALQTHFADRQMRRYQDGKYDADKGFSFQEFLDFLATLDMTAVDIHFRPQFHNLETVKKPDKIINISKQDLIAGLNEFERMAGLPETDFRALRWLHDMEKRRKARQETLPGEALDETVFTHHQVTRLGQFPSYEQLLTPLARAKIAQIYKVDFAAYADYL